MFCVRGTYFLVTLLLFIHQIVGPPASIKKSYNKESEQAKHENIETNEVENVMGDEELNVEYNRYLKEVVSTLETDEDFKKKVEEANKDDIDSGKIANELAMVSHHVRSKLDEVKRKEIERLRELVRERDSKGQGPLHPSKYEHIDHHNLDTFEVEDLNKLIKKVSKDFEEIDTLRRQKFKEYEMEKHFQEEMQMKNMTEKEKEEFKHKLEEKKKKHADHEKIHHPGSKAQFEEVWEKQDHLENQEFNPKTFFYLHDLDGNGYWDQAEVSALFAKELDKLYQAGVPEDDMRERQEEMERMREHVFKEIDKNKDQLISFDEYMEGTKSKEFQEDDGWDTLENQPQYTQQEYEEFEKMRMARMQHHMQQGYYHPDGYHPQGPQMGYHPNQMQPPQYHNQHPNQMHHPDQQYHPNQQYHQPQQQQYHPNQMPQQYHPNQMPHDMMNQNYPQHGYQQHGYPQQAQNQQGNQQHGYPQQAQNQHGNQQHGYPQQAQNQQGNQMNLSPPHSGQNYHDSQAGQGYQPNSQQDSHGYQPHGLQQGSQGYQQNKQQPGDQGYQSQGQQQQGGQGQQQGGQGYQQYNQQQQGSQGYHPNSQQNQQQDKQSYQANTQQQGHHSNNQQQNQQQQQSNSNGQKRQIDSNNVNSPEQNKAYQNQPQPPAGHR